MKSFTLAITSLFAAAVVAQSPTTTITAVAGCPSPASDVVVTRSDVPVPSCAAGQNATKPVVISMSGGAGGVGGGSGASASGTMPAQFTGAAGRIEAGLLGVGAGVLAFML